MIGGQEPIVLRDPTALAKAIRILENVQGGTFTNRPFIGAALDAIEDGDLDGFLDGLESAELFTITGRKEIRAAKELAEWAFRPSRSDN